MNLLKSNQFSCVDKNNNDYVIYQLFKKSEKYKNYIYKFFFFRYNAIYELLTQ